VRALKVLGTVAGIIPWPFILASIILSPWFNVFDNALSDLGNTALNSPAAYIFDVGLILSGLLAAAFGLLLTVRKRSWVFFIWSVPLSLASVDLSLVGAFNESMGDVHFWVSVAFFLIIVVTMLLFSYVSWPLSAPRLGGLSLIFGILSAIVWLVPWPWRGVAIQEMSTSAMMAITLILLARRFGG
jgi:hypothetical membrane protein